jgi:predicted amidohydrolase YtcJ
LGAGYTSIQGGPVSLATAETYRTLEKEGKLKQRVYLWADLSMTEEEFSKTVVFARSLPSDGLVKISAFKGFVDGVISSYTGALLKPYSDKPETSGTPSTSQPQLNEWVLRANRAGFPVALHSIGDRAVRMALDAFETSRKNLGVLPLINRVEHIEFMDPSDAPRFGELHVAASMQPTHMQFGSRDSFYYDWMLGPVRSQNVFPWKRVVEGGALLIFGTDFPVVDEDPIAGLYCAVHRTFSDGTELIPSQKLDPQTAFRAYTLNPAIAVGAGDRLGRIQEGYEADLVLLPKDPMAAAAQSLSENPPTWVMMSGKLVL